MSFLKILSYKCWQWTTPILAGTGITITATPSFAAIFASSTTEVNLFSFSHSPYSTLTSVQTNTFTKAGTIPNVNLENSFENSEFPLFSGQNRAEAQFQAVAFGENTVADVDASVFASESLSTTDIVSISASDSEGNSVASTVESSAIFSTLSPLVSTRISTQSTGDRGTKYQGVSQGDSTVLGKFLIGTDPESKTFSFNFNLSSMLTALVENPKRERAQASSQISVMLLGGSDENDQTVLDFFSVSSQLTKTEQVYENSYSTQNSDNFTFNLFDSFSDTSSNKINLLGSYQRDFQTPTYLTLVEISHTNSTANVPEPLTTFGAGTAVLLGAVFKRKLASFKK